MDALTRRQWIQLSAGVALGAAWPRPARAQARPLRMLLNSGYSGANSFFLLAQDKGHLKGAGVDLSFTPGTSAYGAPRRMMAEGFDVGYGDINALIEAVAEDPIASPVAVYMVFNSTPSALVVRADGRVQLPDDLVGRRVIGRSSDVALHTFGVYAAHARINPDEVNVTPSEEGMDALLGELMSGKADAVVGYSTDVRAAAAAAMIDADADLRFFKYEDLMTEFYGSTVMVSRTLASQSPELVRSLLQAFTRGLKDAILQPDAAIDAVAARDPSIDRATERTRLQGTLDGEMAHPEGERLGIGEVDDGRLAANVVQMVEARKLARVPGILEVFSHDFLPPINERVTSLGRY